MQRQISWNSISSIVGTSADSAPYTAWFPSKMWDSYYPTKIFAKTSSEKIVVDSIRVGQLSSQWQGQKIALTQNVVAVKLKLALVRFEPFFFLFEWTTSNTLRIFFQNRKNRASSKLNEALFVSPAVPLEWYASLSQLNRWGIVQLTECKSSAKGKGPSRWWRVLFLFITFQFFAAFSMPTKFTIFAGRMN